MEKVCQLLFLNMPHKYSRDISKANSRNYCLPASIFLFIDRFLHSHNFYQGLWTPSQRLYFPSSLLAKYIHVAKLLPTDYEWK